MSRENNINESTATGTLLPGAGEAWKYAKAGAKNDWKSIKGDFKKGMPGFKKDLKKKIKSAKKTGKQALNWAKNKVFKEQFISAIVNKDYMLAEKLFNEHMEAIAEMRVKAKKQEVAKKIGQTPFSPSMKHYKQQIRAAVKKMKAQTKIVDGPEKTVRHIHEASKEKLARYIKKANYDAGMADFRHGVEAGKNKKNTAKKKAYAAHSLKRERGIGLAVDKLTGKAKISAKE